MTDELLYNLYYKDFPSLTNLYKSAKAINPNITYKIVKEFLKNTEENQIYKAKPTKFYHLKSYFPFQRCQIDILDLINYVPRNNNGYRYLFLLIDTFTRFVFAIPLKSRTTDEIFDTLTSILQEIKNKGFNVETLDSDNETGFNSKKIVDFLQKEGITQNFSNVGDHNSLGIIDRFCRTIRELLNKYTNSRNTTRWIDYYQTLIDAYNTRIHRSLKTSPIKAIKNNEYYMNKLSNQSFNNLPVIKVGDKVRLLKQKQLFEKGSENNYTKDVFKIIDYKDGFYKVENRERKYKISELLPVNNVIIYKNENKSGDNNNNNKESQIKQHKMERTIKRNLNKEGIEKENVVQNKRVRKPVDMGFFLKDY
jgi:hypothetical protein